MTASGARVLITGGAGFLGINLSRFLHGRGYAVRCLDLAEFDYPDMRPFVDAVRGDVRDPVAVERVIDGIDFVVHAAAALPLYSPEDIFSTDIEGTRTVLAAAARHRVKRFVHISSTAVYRIANPAPIREDDPLEGVGPYGEAKIQAEARCLAGRAAGLVVSILRPATFVGPERLGIFDILFDWALDRRHFPLLGSGENRVQMLHVADLCRAIERCLTLPAESVNDTFNIGAKDFGTMKSDYQAVLDEAGFGRRIVPLPAAPAVAALRILDRMGLSPIYRWVYETAVRDRVFSIEKAERHLQFVPEHSNRDALVDNLRWYREMRPRFEAKAGVSHRAPWKQGAVGLVKRFF